MVKPYYQDSAVTIYHGDCREILPTLNQVDLVITDPPYGIDFVKSNKHLKDYHGNDRVWANIKNDSDVPDLSLVFVAGIHVVVFGANYFPSILPHRGRWIVWDKRVTERADNLLGSPFEIAWTNRTSGYDWIFRIQHGGVINADSYGKNNLPRFHPTQKPVRLFKAIIQKFKDNPQTILDPFMGSGTTLRAAKDLNKKAIGIEIEEKYCEIAALRMSQEVLQFESQEPASMPEEVSQKENIECVQNQRTTPALCNADNTMELEL